jgi:hypothetical protein
MVYIQRLWRNAGAGKTLFYRAGPAHGQRAKKIGYNFELAQRNPGKGLQRPDLEV